MLQMPKYRCGTVSVLGLLVLGLAGCDEKMPMWTGLGTPPTHIPGIESPDERKTALQDLAKNASTTPDPAQREAICRELAQQIRKEPDSIIRGEILRTLAAYGGQTAAVVLRAAVKDTDADVRKLVCDLWGRRGDAEAARVLADILAHDSDKDVRMAAARGLGKSHVLHDPIAERALATALDDGDPAMQYCAMVSLGTVTGKDLGNDVDKWRQYVKTGTVPDDRSWAERTFGWLR
jgi:sugar phosphate isomerase/epimerase